MRRSDAKELTVARCDNIMDDEKKMIDDIILFVREPERMEV